MSKSVSYGIVGGGLSGTLLCIYLMKYNKKPLTLFLFEKKPEQLHKGVAYSSKLPYQLLNVPVKGMSLLEDDSLHFYDWLKTQNIDITPDDFVSRKLFGEYLSDYLKETVEENKQHDVIVIQEEVTNIREENGSQIIYCSNHSGLKVSKVFLCTGNFPASNLKGFSKAVLESNYYVSNPWSGDNLSQINSNDTILVVGTGLTMVDQVMSITKHTDFKGKIIAISRRGLLPLPHGETPTFQISQTIDFTKCTFLELYQFIKKEVKKAKSLGLSYRSVIESIRPHLDRIWRNLSLTDKKQFITHFKPYWEIHRHRIPAKSSDYLKSLINQNKLKIVAGRINIAEIKNDKILVETQLKGCKKVQEIEVSWIINCTGSLSNYKDIDSKLYTNLFINNVLTSAEFNFGLNTTEQGFGVNSKGDINKNIILVGPTAKGNNFWEITALKEIRQQVNLIIKEVV